MNTIYAGSLTLDEYKNNPNQSNSFTEQYFSSYVTTGGFKYNFNTNLSLETTFNDENKISNYVTYQSKFKYDYKENLSLFLDECLKNFNKKEFLAFIKDRNRW